jgi:hypothetical protein
VPIEQVLIPMQLSKNAIFDPARLEHKFRRHCFLHGNLEVENREKKSKNWNTEDPEVASTLIDKCKRDEPISRANAWTYS